MNTMKETQLSKTGNKTKTVKDWINSEQFKSQVALALPKHLTPDRFIRVALTTILRVPKLADCSVESVMNAMLTCSQLGLEPDGRRAHLIPYGNQCQLIIDYKGKVELAMRSGTVSNIHADVICENDEFEYDRGEIKHHRIDFRKDRGGVYAAYAICRFKDGTEKADVMARTEIESVRKRSRAGNNGPWVTDWNEMAKKTVFHRLSKWITLSPEFRDALEFDDDEPAEKPANVKPIFETSFLDAPSEQAEEQPSAGQQTPATAQADAQSDAGERAARSDDNLPGLDQEKPKKTEPARATPREALAKPKKTEPARATPREALANLMKASHVSDASLLAFLKSQDEPFSAVSEIPDGVITPLLAKWDLLEKQMDRSI